MQRIAPLAVGETAADISVMIVVCRPALTTADHRWLMPSLSCFYPQPGGACRTTGLSRSSYPGLRQKITRGPKAALYRHTYLWVLRGDNPFPETTGVRPHGILRHYTWKHHPG
jgi:hypothetical protein